MAHIVLITALDLLRARQSLDTIPNSDQGPEKVTSVFCECVLLKIDHFSVVEVKSQIWTELKGEPLPSLLAEKDQLKTFLRATVDSRTEHAFRGYNLDSSYPLTPYSYHSERATKSHSKLGTETGPEWDQKEKQLERTTKGERRTLRSCFSQPQQNQLPFPLSLLSNHTAHSVLRGPSFLTVPRPSENTNKHTYWLPVIRVLGRGPS